ncbi:hypothetical protein [Peribacillus simplex]|uniref:hypothetical protein n=1 Tax=Peribacillus simplex TaxID=1478 RepID=UPI0036DC3081
MNNKIKTLINDTLSDLEKTKNIAFKVEFTDSDFEDKYTKIMDYYKANNSNRKPFSRQSSSSSFELNAIINPSKNESDIDYYLSLQENSKKQAAHFLGMLRNDFVEAGYFSTSELFLKSQLIEKPLETKDWLNRILIDNLSKPDILVKLLHIISDIDYRLIEPQGPTLALAASRHQDSEVQEYSIRVFEKWGNKESLDILRKIHFQEKWLQEYADEVISDLEEEFS